MSESWVVERLFQHAGLDCVVAACDAGHRCGYVRVPEGHPWHGIECGGKVPGVAPNLEREIGQSFMAKVAALSPKESAEEYTQTLDGIVSVHGGLTFSAQTDFRGKVPDGWWIGFDCAHLGDAKDPAIMSKTYQDIEARWPRDGGHIWYTDNVARECEALAEQIAARRGAYESEVQP